VHPVGTHPETQNLGQYAGPAVGGMFEFLVACRFPWIELGWSLDNYPKYFNTITGLNWTLDDIWKTADRIYGMIKLNSTAGANLSLDRDLFLRNVFSEDLPSCEDIELFIKLRRMKDVAILLDFGKLHVATVGQVCNGVLDDAARMAK
jgi:aldehyde:ferredoxin oxidoreductase